MNSIVIIAGHGRGPRWADMYSIARRATFGLILPCLVILGCHPPVAPSPHASPLPSTVNLVLDTSASMQGYFKGNTELKSSVASLVSSLDKLSHSQGRPDRVDFQFSEDNGNLQTSSLNSNEFLQQLIDNQMIKGQDTLLQQVFQHIIEESNSTTMSILITDGIFSYSSADVKKNPEVNRENIEGLASSVQLLFNEARAKGVTVSLLALTSQFHGTYYDFRNNHIKCCQEPRPYYIWLFGNPSSIAAIRSYLDSEGFHAVHSIDFTPSYGDIQLFPLQYADPKVRVYRSGDDTLVISKSPQTDQVIVKVALDLSQLPQDLVQADDLRYRFEVASPQIEIKSWNLQTRQEASSSLHQRDKDALMKDRPGYTHVLTLIFSNSFARNGDIVFRLPSSPPDWYKSWSNGDDTNMVGQTTKTTYGLQYFIEAISKAYSGNSPDQVGLIHVKR